VKQARRSPRLSLSAVSAAARRGFRLVVVAWGLVVCLRWGVNRATLACWSSPLAQFKGIRCDQTTLVVCPVAAESPPQWGSGGWHGPRRPGRCGRAAVSGRQICAWVYCWQPVTGHHREIAAQSSGLFYLGFLPAIGLRLP